MLTDEQLIRELRASLEYEAAGIDPSPGLLACVRRELHKTSDRDKRSWSRWPPADRSFVSARILLIGLVLVLATAAVALAAAGVFAPGSPVGPSVPPVPTANDGAAIPGTVRLLSLRVPDPRGGPPWGLRIVQTTRGETCVQVGRLSYGTIGVLGQDGAFGNDHRFHPFSASYLEPGWCAVTDARGHAFLNVGMSGFPASGLVIGGPAISCRLTNDRHVPGWRLCPPQDLRDISFGLLGPDAVNVTHRDPSGHLITTPTVGSDGVYLVILPHRQNEEEGMATIGVDGGLGTGAIQTVRYRDGHACQPSETHACPLVGFAAPLAQRLTASQVAAPVTAHVVPAKSYCTAPGGNTITPCGPHPPRGFSRIGGAPGTLINVSFTARVAVTSSRSYYQLDVNYPKSRRCTVGGTTGPTTTDIHAGQRITMQEFAPNSCLGTFHGDIRYAPRQGPSVPTANPAGPGRSLLVGRFAVTVR